MIQARPFRDRGEAGERLAQALTGRVEPPVVVLGIPRGGILVADPVARALRASLDVVVPKKIGAPGHEELGVGAVAPGVQIVDEQLVARLGIAPDRLAVAIVEAQEEVRRRTALFRGERAPTAVEAATVVLVDDGIATGGTALAAIAWARRSGARRVVVAAPVAPVDVIDELARHADDVVVVIAARNFVAVGAWYEDFAQTTDEEVIAALAAADM